MGRTFGFKTAFKHTKQSVPQKAEDDEKTVRKASRREAFGAFFKTNTQKLPKGVKRPGNRKTQVIHVNPPSKRNSQYVGQRPLSQYPGQRPISFRPSSIRSTSQVIMPPPDTKEPAILAAWGPKSPSLRPTSHYSMTMHDSVTGRNQLPRSPLSATSFSKMEPRLLSEDEVEKMFEGAPLLEVVDLLSSLLSRVKITEARGNATDVEPFAHYTFTAASLLNDGINDEGALRELPNMRGLAGGDAGTVGQAYFLQLPISDSKLTDDGHDTTSKRMDLLAAPETLGLRPLDLASLIDRLSELSQAQQYTRASQMTVPDEQKAAEMYTDLFSRLLTTPKFASSTEDDPTGLEVQMAALAMILDASDIWYDFSYVEWRIRLGQLLWSEPEEANLDVEGQAVCERDIVLLQISLASELLVRMEMSCKPLASRALSKKIQWDLVLAQRFLDNVQITQKTAEEKQSSRTNRSSVFSALTFVTANEDPQDTRVEPILFPRHEKRQLEGLLRFAETLHWPHVQDMRQRFQEKQQKHSLLSPALLTPGSVPAMPSPSSAYATPVSSPGQLTASSETEYFSRPKVGRIGTAQSVQLLPASAYGSESLDAGGWMSRSWLTGLVLPGEATSHFLIATLLENSSKAIETLGDTANLYGGFVYSGRSYWSKSCVVGRVLAAQKGATDCMGWISSPSVLASPANDWVDIESKDLPTDAPRISQEGLVAKDSAFVRGENKEAVNEDDFTWPVDSPPVMGNEARYEGFSLRPTNPNSELSAAKTAQTPAEQDGLALLSTSTACLTFTPKSSKHSKTTMPLLHDVYFISSHPCFPSSRSRPASTHNNNNSSNSSPHLTPYPTDEKELPDPPCHPLHSSYAMEVVPAATLLSCADDSYQGGEQILVLDCRGSNELELLSRAWCAKIGQNALVAKQDRTCLSCCVRMACGLGVKVVIRI